MSFALYIHIPYCARKCPYCDFNVHIVRAIPEDAYVEALSAEIRHYANRAPWSGRRISSVYLGGGTPTLFSPASIERLLGLVDTAFGLDEAAEVSIEANPEDLITDSSLPASLAAAGVGRMSLGVQSFDAGVLETLGRAHTPAEAQKAIERARQAIDRVSVDLIFAVPGGSTGQWARDIDRTTSAGVEHVSIYNLTFEEGTPLTGLRDAGRIEQESNETEAALYAEGVRRFESAGLAQYEVASFARPGAECRHNTAYWHWRDYLGIGAGAHGFTANAPEAPFGQRYVNARQPALYMSRAAHGATDESETLDRATAMSEMLLTGLRTHRGVDGGRFHRIFGCRPGEAFPRTALLRDRGLVQEADGALSLTPEARPLADTVIEDLLREIASE